MQRVAWVKVCDSVHRWVCLSACWDTPWEQTPPQGADIPGVEPPRSRQPTGSRHPPGAVHAGRYGQKAAGTHPTGMHSCCKESLRLRLS